MGLAPLVFTGVSTYSSDLQTVLNRAVSIANLPVTQLQNQQKDLVQQKLLVTNLSDASNGLANSITALGQLAQYGALSATSSQPTLVTATATNTGSTSPANYTISNITSIASAAAETSVSGYSTDPTAAVSSTGKVRLVFGSTTKDITLGTGKNNLGGLRDAINNLGVGVTATVLTTGTGANPNYLSVTSNTAGATTLQLFDDPTGANTNLLTANNQGADTVFKFNGVNVRRQSTFVNDLVQGTTFNILGTTTGTQTVNVTLATDRSKISSALQNVVNNYNAVSEQVTAQTGKNAGLLSGDFLVREVSSDLRTLSNFEGTGSIKSLADLGVEFDASGKATLNQTTFNALSDSQIQAGISFLGSSSTGFGALAARFTQISDPTNGLAKLQLDQYDTTDKRITSSITTLQDRISTMQTALSSRLQAADALLAQMQSQQQVVTSSVQSLNLVLYGRNTG